MIQEILIDMYSKGNKCTGFKINVFFILFLYFMRQPGCTHGTTREKKKAQSVEITFCKCDWHIWQGRWEDVNDRELDPNFLY